MKPHLTKLMEAFVKDEYGLDNVKLKISVVEAIGPKPRIAELMRHSSGPEE